VPQVAATAINVRSRLLLLLAWVAGGVDAISYLSLGGVFTANMTGNTVLLGVALGQLERQAAVQSSLAMVGFLVGVALGARTASRGRHHAVWPPAFTISLGLEGVLLAILAVVWHLVGDPAVNPMARAGLIVLAALAMGLQSAVARRINISGIATTYITGTLTNLIARLVTEVRGVPAPQASPEQVGAAANAVQSVPSTGLLAATWVMYMGGAAAAAMLISFLGPLFALALPIILMTIVTLTAIIYFRRH
jgi:uncharacterized membrane protein YoaK (UPF0700 family)